MIRRLFTVLSVPSLLICLATFILLIRSQAHLDEVTYCGWSSAYELFSENGALVVGARPSGVSRSAAVLDMLYHDPRFAGYTPPPEWVAELKRDGTPHWEFASAVGHSRASYSLRPKWLAALGVGLARERWYYDAGQGGCWVVIPYWLLAGLSPLPLLRSFALWRRARKRSLRDTCVSCGYDLRVSKDRCPECGTPIPATSEPGNGSGRSGTFPSSCC